MYTSDGELNVMAPTGEQIDVFNLIGQVLSSKQSDGAICRFNLTNNQIYFVRIRDKVSKVIVKGRTAGN
jgi:hypothetical protein